jgi:hypothetical protein
MVGRMQRELEPLAAEGDFDRFYRAQYVRLVRALLLLIGDPGEAEDLAQEALSRVYERWDRVSAMDSSEGYLFRTALNLHRKRARRLRAGARAEASAPTPAADEASVDDLKGASIEIRPLTWCLPRRRPTLGWGGSPTGDDEPPVLGSKTLIQQGCVLPALAHSSNSSSSSGDSPVSTTTVWSSNQHHSCSILSDRSRGHSAGSVYHPFSSSSKSSS